MNEFFARNRLSAYLDGELPTAEAREVEAAVARNPELRAELHTLRAGIALLRAGGPLRAPDGFAERLQARLEREPDALGWRRHLRGVRIEAVMLAAAAAVVLIFAAQRPPDPSAPTPEDGAPLALGPAIDAASVPILGSAPVTAVPDTLVADPPGADPPGADPPVARAPSRTKQQAVKAAVAKKGEKPSGIEREPYIAAWEQQEESSAPVVYAPAPFQYRLRPTSDAGLRELAALAASLGGSLADDRGRVLAPYRMESGDVRTVRLLLPSVSAGAVAARLAELGALEVINTSGRTVYGAGGVVPVVVEVTQR